MKDTGKVLIRGIGGQWVAVATVYLERRGQEEVPVAEVFPFGETTRKNLYRARAFAREQSAYCFKAIVLCAEAEDSLEDVAKKAESMVGAV